MLAELALRDRPVALIASDQRMPGMTGVEFLDQARTHAPDAKLVLLTAYADTDAAIKAINDIGLDYYLLKPWEPPEERLYPVIDDLLERLARGPPGRRRRACASSGTAGRTGATRSRRSWRGTTCRTLARRSSATRRRVGSRSCAQATDADLPLVLVPDGERAAIAVDAGPRRRALGLRTSAEQPLYDLCIVGSGPAGLAAAVYAASEGLQRRRGRTRSPGRPGRPERVDRELPRVPEGPVRRRPHAPRRRAGAALRRGDGPRARRRRPRERGPVRAVRFDDGSGDRGARGARGDGRVVPAARRRRGRTSSRGAACTTARRRARRARARATTSTSSARPTRRDRPR